MSPLSDHPATQPPPSPSKPYSSSASSPFFEHPMAPPSQKRLPLYEDSSPPSRFDTFLPGSAYALAESFCSLQRRASGLARAFTLSNSPPAALSRRFTHPHFSHAATPSPFGCLRSALHQKAISSPDFPPFLTTLPASPWRPRPHQPVSLQHPDHDSCVTFLQKRLTSQMLSLAHGSVEPLSKGSRREVYGPRSYGLRI